MRQLEPRRPAPDGSTADGIEGQPGLPSYRWAMADDVPALAELDALCFPEHAYSEGLISRFLEAGHPCLVAEEREGGRRIGFVIAMGGLSGGSGLLVTLDVAPGWRRQGVGSALVGMCAMELVRGDITRGAGMWLTVAAGNVGAIAFYEALGFCRSGEIPGYYRDDDAIIMVHEDMEHLVALAPWKERVPGPSP